MDRTMVVSSVRLLSTITLLTMTLHVNSQQEQGRPELTAGWVGLGWIGNGSKICVLVGWLGHGSEMADVRKIHY